MLANDERVLLINQLASWGCYLACHGSFDDAIEGYAATGAADRLIDVGDLFCENGIYEPALIAYAAAGATEKLVGLGDRLLGNKNHCATTIAAYKGAGASLRLRRCGQLFRRNRWHFDALTAFAAAGARDELIQYGEFLLTIGLFGLAVQVYAAAGTPITQEQLVSCGETYLSKGWYNLAVQVFDEAKCPMPIDKLIACGDMCYRNGQVAIAMRCFRAALDLKQ